MSTGKFSRVANDSFITLLDTYVDIMSDAGRIVTNCESCGQLMITNRANAFLTCGSKILHHSVFISIVLS